ncbi:serine hydrolase domain-containing protein [Mucilaginibacter segetis]|uniref:Beta-lactamase family protein n=1 Tax=Mucilaginibacter segetis TaxID=2793071 RepID=A0A934PS48_9SPHI|nr:serine hydrolase domain-containing protein [Mucilaginibacter segetis]MBK0378632.1 beta-lactamase family protein [Mucilaginibacter segetis]
MKKYLPGLLLLFAAVNTAVAQDFDKQKLDSLLDVLAAGNKSTGSLAISKNGQIIYQKATGFIDIRAQKPANVQTKYRIGSISKMFTGVMVFQLIEEGKLSLQTKLSQFYPQIPNADKITIGNMLNHHSGLFNITTDPEFLTYMATPQTHQQMLAKMAAHQPDFEPGTRMAYSNTNFILLGYILEKITGKAYPDLVKQRIINKIGLKNTYYGGKINTANNEALSYNYKGKWDLMPESDMSIPGGAGAMVSTPTDLDRFIEALFAGKLISAASLEQMKTITDNIGMGMFSIPFYENKGYGHNGTIDGFRSTLVYFPDDKLAVAYIKNGGNYEPNDVLIGALSVCFNKPYNLPQFIQINPAQLDKYIGVYASTQVPLKITVTKNGDVLMAQPAGQPAFVLEPTKTKHRFVFKAAGVVMEFNPDNEQFTLKQGGGEFLFTKDK